MSGADRRAELAVIAGGGQGAPNAKTARAELEHLLALEGTGWKVTGARIVGRGASASADLYLKVGGEAETIYFETVREIADAKRLTIEVIQATGITPALKAPQALRVLALMRAIADIQATETADDESSSWGLAYLLSAPSRPVRMGDQADRWQAFSALDAIDPWRDSQADAKPLVKSSLVLVDVDTGARFVRASWFAAHVRQEDKTVSPHQIAERMTRIGWDRRGREGKIKATRPQLAGPPLIWAFYIVPHGWEDAFGDDGGAS